MAAENSENQISTTFRVQITKLDRNFVAMRMDHNLVNESKKIIDKLTKHHITSVICVQKPEMYEEFPDEMPNLLKYDTYLRKQSLKNSTVKREHSLEEEAKKFIKEDRVDQKPRRTRFSGSYNVELEIKKQESKVSVEPPKKRGRPSKQTSETSFSSVSTNQSRVQPLKLKLVKKGNELEVEYQQENKQESSSSDSSDSEVEAVSQQKVIQPQEVIELPEPVKTPSKVPRPRKLSSSSSEDESVTTQEINNNVKLAPEVAEKVKIPPVAVSTSVKKSIIPAVTTNSRAIPTTTNRVKPKIEVRKQDPVVKKPFMKPPIIEPPQFHPRTSKPLAKPLRHRIKNPPPKPSLGGIFDIDNGWDKHEEPKKISNGYSIPKIAPKPVVFHAPEMTEIDDAHNAFSLGIPEFNFNENPKKRDKFSRHDDTDDESESDEEIYKRKSMFSEDEGEEVPPVVERTSEPPAKRHKPELQIVDDEDRLSIGDAEDILGDFEDEAEAEPVVKPREMTYTTDLDELRMTVRKEVVPLTKEEAKLVFDKNTMEIMKRSFDDAGKKIVNMFFPGICVAFLESSCASKTCRLRHELPNLSLVREKMEKYGAKEVDDVYGFAIKFPKLFDHLFQLIAEMFIIKLNDGFVPKIARMIMDCEKSARSHSMYRNIVDALQIAGKMARYRAVRFLIDHATDSPYAQEQIMPMILETGPDVVQLLPYFQSLSQRRSIPLGILDKLLENCTTYQNPNYPDFILDRLLTLNVQQRKKLKGANVTKFIELMTALVGSNEMREKKTLDFATQMIGSHPGGNVQQQQPTNNGFHY